MFPNLTQVRADLGQAFSNFLERAKAASMDDLTPQAREDMVGVCQSAATVLQAMGCDASSAQVMLGEAAECLGIPWTKWPALMTASIPEKGVDFPDESSVKIKGPFFAEFRIEFIQNGRACLVMAEDVPEGAAIRVFSDSKLPMTLQITTTNISATLIGGALLLTEASPIPTDADVNTLLTFQQDGCRRLRISSMESFSISSLLPTQSEIAFFASLKGIERLIVSLQNFLHPPDVFVWSQGYDLKNLPLMVALVNGLQFYHPSAYAFITGESFNLSVSFTDPSAPLLQGLPANDHTQDPADISGVHRSDRPGEAPLAPLEDLPAFSS